MENIKTPEDHIPEVLNRVKKEYVERTYKIKEWTDTTDFLEKLAQRTGKLLKVRYGGVPAGTTYLQLLLDV